MEKLFKNVYGISTYDYVMDRRFNAVKELLGIENENLFYKLFEENENMSPEEYGRR